MIRVDEWGDDDTWTGWFANRTLYYPSLDLKISDMKRSINRQMRASDREVQRIQIDEQKEMDRFKKCAKKGNDREELKHYANLIAGHRARKRRNLAYKEAYQRCLQEMEDIKMLREQTRDMNRMGKILGIINQRLPLHIMQKLLRQFEVNKEKLNTKNQWVDETLVDQDLEYENKEQDSDRLIDTLLFECNMRLDSLPTARASELEAQKRRDAEELRKLETLG